ncbi:HEAT repeat domain-containing protein [Nodosilinea sp. LEGE 07088]|uniref:HEAT repeat domain-containing protein n=1 Tax=Nodosilinea sp. LEGE 07088 TaxID=2777968 RepID=UPI001D139CDD|nr:HEAT repeat domain-containing protein [Nodosilinea sp. LEGE 07088]
MAIPSVFLAEAVAPSSTVAGPQAERAPTSRSKLGWILGSVVLLGGLGGGLVLARSQFQKSTKPRLSDQATDSDSDLSGPNLSDGTQASAASVPQKAAGLPIETEPAADQALDTTRLSSVDIVDSLVGELSSLDGSVRRHAIWELGQRGHSAAIAPLVNGLLAADSQEKSLILAALAEISSRNLKPMYRALALGLQDPSPEVRKNAIRDLSRVYDTVAQLSPMLAHAAQDPDPEVQATAQWALRQLNRSPAAPYPGMLPSDADSQASSCDNSHLPPS